MSYNKPRAGLKSRWSVSYKKSINCNNPKGFSQKNYCKRKKRGGKYMEGVKTFKDYLTKNHPEAIEEGWGKNLVTAGLIGLAGMKAGSFVKPTVDAIRSSVQSDGDFDDSRSVDKYNQKLLVAAKRAGVPKNEWGNLKGHAIGGVVTIVNGRKVPLSPKEAERVRDAQELSRRMGN